MFAISSRSLVQMIGARVRFIGTYGHAETLNVLLRPYSGRIKLHALARVTPPTRQRDGCKESAGGDPPPITFHFGGFSPSFTPNSCNSVGRRVG